MLLDEMELTLKSTLDVAEEVARIHAGAEDAGGNAAELKLQQVHRQLRASLERLPARIQRATLANRHPTLFRLHPPQVEHPNPEPEAEDSPLRVRRGSPTLLRHASPADNIERFRVVPGVAAASYTRSVDRSSGQLPRSSSSSWRSAPTRQAVSPRGSSTRATPVSARQVAGKKNDINDVQTVASSRAPCTVRQSPAGTVGWTDDPLLDREQERSTQERKVDQRVRLTQRLSPAKVRAMTQRQQDWEQRRLEKLRQKREAAEVQEQKRCTFSPNRRRPAQRTVAQCQEAAERLSTTATNRDAQRKQARESLEEHELAEQKKHRFHSPRSPARAKQLVRLAKPTRPPPRRVRGQSPGSPSRPSNKFGSPGRSSPGRSRSPTRIQELSRPRSRSPASKRPESPNSKTEKNGVPRRVNEAAAASGQRLYEQAVTAQQKRAQAHTSTHGPSTRGHRTLVRLSPSPSSSPTSVRKSQTLPPVEDDA